MTTKAVVPQGGTCDFLGKRWTEGQRRAALYRYPHKLILAHVPFFQEEFAFMVDKG